jgi:predicted dehydrogenase
MENLKLGIVGSRRGSDFKSVCDALDGVEIHAVCDLNEDALSKSKKIFNAKESYLNYEEMLEHAKIDAVLISTPINLHVSQSIEALKRNIHVLCEVTAGVSIDECKELVQACKDSDANYMMAENYNYTKSNQIVKKAVDSGFFGTPYYAEGEYIHDVKEYAITTPWRKRWLMEIEGLTYCTHSLGPILQWMSGDRIVKVCCEAAGSRHEDHEGKPFSQAASTMMCKTEKNALIKIQVDLVSDRPHAPTNYRLQGTDGCYESSRGGPWDKDKIWLRERDPKFRWRELSLFSDVPELAKKYLPEIWSDVPDAVKRTGHGGGDFFIMQAFINSILNKTKPPIGVHEAMDMTLPGLISQQSILQDGAWLGVPDSRDW